MHQAACLLCSKKRFFYLRKKSAFDIREKPGSENKFECPKAEKRLFRCRKRVACLDVFRWGRSAPRRPLVRRHYSWPAPVNTPISRMYQMWYPQLRKFKTHKKTWKRKYQSRQFACFLTCKKGPISRAIQHGFGTLTISFFACKYPPKPRVFVCF